MWTVQDSKQGPAEAVLYCQQVLGRAPQFGERSKRLQALPQMDKNVDKREIVERIRERMLVGDAS